MMKTIENQAAAVIRERDGRRLGSMARALALGVILVGGVLGYVWLQVQGVRLTYELEDLRSVQGDVEGQNRKLRLELLTLRSFARVESAARRLGLTEPARDQVQPAREFVLEDLDAVRTAARSAGPALPDARP